MGIPDGRGSPLSMDQQDILQNMGGRMGFQDSLEHEVTRRLEDKSPFPCLIDRYRKFFIETDTTGGQDLSVQGIVRICTENCIIR